MILAATVHTHTPTLTVIDPRRLVLRSVGYLLIDQEGLHACVTRTGHDVAGRPAAHWDPRLWANAQANASVQPNTRRVAGLSGEPLLDDSVDGGRTTNLFDTQGQPRYTWTGRSTRRTAYDTLGRPTTVHERLGTDVERCAERLSYGPADAATAATRRCGRVVRHDDPAGTRLYDDYDLAGEVRRDTRYFLSGASPADWPEDPAERTALLETDAFITRREQDALAEPCRQTDAAGHTQRIVRNVAGQTIQHWLGLSTKAERCVARDLAYNAADQIVERTLGNGVTSQWTYDDADGRLRRLITRRTDTSCLQDLSYTYDPARYVLSITDATEATRLFAGRRVAAMSAYRYDTLYRLIEATGLEQASALDGPGRPAWQPFPSETPIDYRRTYHYDEAGNLLRFQHTGASHYERTMTVSPGSNRSLPQPDSGDADFDGGFDARGNLKELQRGQLLSWNGRDELAMASLVTRIGEADDTEAYAYNGAGERIRKRRTYRVNGRDVVDDVRYLPGLEIRSNGNTGERLHVIQGQAEAADVHALHWLDTPPAGLTNDAFRYALTDHLNSCAIELDDNAATISQERYYAFGGTSFAATRNVLEADYRTIRYAGKERDGSGLYYYGSRYYAPWMHRWTQPDPAGIADGLNGYAFVHDDPVNHVDLQGGIAVSLDGYVTPSRQAMASGPLDPSLARLTDHPAMPENADSFSDIPTFVDAATFDRLDLADRAIHMTKMILSYGAENQLIDILRTNALNQGRLKYRSPNIHAGRAVLEVLTKQATGRCMEHAQFTYALLSQQSLDTPLMHVQAEDSDHAFTLLGDPREISEDKVVVVDAWVSLPMAHLLSEGNFSFGRAVDSLSPGTPSPELAIDSTWLIEPPQDVGGIDRADLKLVKAWEEGLPGLWNEEISTSIIGGSYTDGPRRARYDVFPRLYLDEHERFQDHVRSIMERMGPLPG